MGTEAAPERKRSTAALPGVLTVVVLVLAVLAAGFMGEFSADPVLEPRLGVPEQRSTPLPTTTATPGPLPDHGERTVLDGGTAVAVLLVLVVAGFALLVRFLLRFRSQPEPGGGLGEQTDLRQPGALEPVATALPVWTETAGAALRTGTDTSDAVIRCWLDLEKLCADAGMPRTPAQTTSDFAAFVSTALDLPPAPGARPVLSPPPGRGAAGGGARAAGGRRRLEPVRGGRGRGRAQRVGALAGRAPGRHTDPQAGPVGPRTPPGNGITTARCGQVLSATRRTVEP